MASDLHERLIAAHEAGDKLGLVELYVQAASNAENLAEQRFFLTHAYIFALDAGLARAAALKLELIGLGAEVPD